MINRRIETGDETRIRLQWAMRVLIYSLALAD